MTSDQKLRDEAPDALDALIRVILRESAAGVEPPSRVWERIEERISKSTIQGDRTNRPHRTVTRVPCPGALSTVRCPPSA